MSYNTLFFSRFERCLFVALSAFVIIGLAGCDSASPSSDPYTVPPLGVSLAASGFLHPDGTFRAVADYVTDGAVTFEADSTFRLFLEVRTRTASNADTVALEYAGTYRALGPFLELTGTVEGIEVPLTLVGLADSTAVVLAVDPFDASASDRPRQEIDFLGEFARFHGIRFGGAGQYVPAIAGAISRNDLNGTYPISNYLYAHPYVASTNFGCTNFPCVINADRGGQTLLTTGTLSIAGGEYRIEAEVYHSAAITGETTPLPPIELEGRVIRAGSLLIFDPGQTPFTFGSIREGRIAVNDLGYQRCISSTVCHDTFLSAVFGPADQSMVRAQP